MVASTARNLVNLEAVSKSYGTRVLLDAVSLGVAADDRIGVVGRNGDGKTTLISLLTDRLTPDRGRVTHTGDLRLGMLAQHEDLPPTATVRELVVGDRAEHEWAGDARVRDVLTGLFGGLDLPALPAGLDTVVGPLSGGERRRIELARLLIAERDLVVLDEPTNHLDVEGIAWLAGHLRTRRSALVVVTHDRWFLDEVCTRTWEVAGGAVHAYEGGYSAYVLARAERERIAASTEVRRRNLLRKELAWLRRGPPARTAKPKFRVEAANALVDGEPPPRDSLELARFATTRLGRTGYELHDVTVRVGERDLLDRLTWQLGPGDRVGLVGVNGSGKTSLLRLLVGAVRPAAGKLVVGRTVRAAYLSQEVIAAGARSGVSGGERPAVVGSALDPTMRVLEAVESVKKVISLGKGREVTASQLCERFGFVGDRQWTPVADLSGGERRRLALLRLLMDEPNVLLLDEPTNDLDIETLTALEDLLDGWPGSLLVVSHDRYFVERVCDQVVALLGDGRLRHLPGGIDEYLKRRRAMAGGAGVVGVTSKDRPVGRRGSGDSRAARKELVRLERAVGKLEDQEAALRERMAVHAADYAKLTELDRQVRELRVERDTLEERWLKLSEEV